VISPMGASCQDMVALKGKADMGAYIGWFR
jgi:hypothetical protein